RPDEADSLTWGELRQVLHEELARLPERFRAPLLLCYLEGLTQDEAARRLGWPATTLKGRLGTGRDLLRKRLAGRGFALSAPLFAVLFAGNQAEAASLPPTLGVRRGAVAARVPARAGVLGGGGVPRSFGLVSARPLVAGAGGAGAAGLPSRPPPAGNAVEEPARAALAEEPAQAPPADDPAAPA